MWVFEKLDLLPLTSESSEALRRTDQLFKQITNFDKLFKFSLFYYYFFSSTTTKTEHNLSSLSCMCMYVEWEHPPPSKTPIDTWLSIGLLVGLLVMSPPGFKARVNPSLRLFASSPTCNRFIRFTTGMTPTDLLTTRMAAKPFWSTYLYIHFQALVGLEPGIEWTAQCVTDALSIVNSFHHLWTMSIFTYRWHIFIPLIIHNMA